MIPLRHFLIFASATSGPFAGELKVDINRDTKNNDQYTKVGFVKWSQGSFDGATSTDGTAGVTRSFTTAAGENVSITFAQTASSAAAGGEGLSAIYYATAVNGEADLIGDGLAVKPANFSNGGQIEMTITGLEAGKHSLLTYHNAADNFVAGSLGPIDVFVDGTQVIDDHPQTIRELTNTGAASTYVNFTVTGPADSATILFAAEQTTGSFAIRNPMINGFEIDTPNIYKVSSNPLPAHEDWHVDADNGTVSLSWTPALSGDTSSHDVYFGKDFNAVKNATTASAEFLGNQATTTRTVAITERLAAYYWRIDKVTAGGGKTAGPVWAFRPRVPAFPGAEGYGRFARGGRGGTIVKVASLADYDDGDTPIPGTLRHAIEEAEGPRIIIFDVSGLITLERRLTLSDDNVTIAGQSAPGKGICIRQYALGLSGSDDSIVRFIRNRPGNISGETIDGGGLAGCVHSIMDHCSISWSIDEAFSSRNAGNITLQRTLISEALNIAGHQNYPAGTAHGYAATVGGEVASLHHNLLAHCEGRNWSMGGGLDGNGEWAGRLDIRNNVVYNWGSRTTDGGAHEVNFVNNYYKPGAATSIFTALNPTYDNLPGTQQYHMSGNVMPGRFNESNQATGRTVAGSNGGSVPTTYPVWVASPFFESHVTTHTATEAYRRVLSDVGCSLPLQDDHDQRMIEETRTGTFSITGQGPFGGKPGLPNSQEDSGGWENYPGESRPDNWDSDRDGMPAWWEALHGFNPDGIPEDFTESHRDVDNDGRTDLEDYLNWIAEPHAFTGPGKELILDASILFAGYDSPRTFSLVSSSNGTASMETSGQLTFTPSPGYVGLVEIQIAVSSSGGNLTRTIQIAVTNHPSVKTLRFRSGQNWSDSTWWNGSLPCAWQEGNIPLFPKTGEDFQTLTIDTPVTTSGLVVDGNYLFNGDEDFSVEGNSQINGTVIFSGPFNLLSSAPWEISGTLDFLTLTGSHPASLTTLPGGKFTTPADLRVENVSQQGDSTIISAQLFKNHQYELQSSPDLQAESWQAVPGTTMEGSGTIEELVDPFPTPATRFYRVSTRRD
ncbi:MAG: T9SS C-terminal target domain-containing protein [Akkermansiaceae bacterium]